MVKVTVDSKTYEVLHVSCMMSPAYQNRNGDFVHETIQHYGLIVKNNVYVTICLEGVAT